MKLRVVVEAAAYEDIEIEIAYIASQNEGASRRFSESIWETFDLIASFPGTGAQTNFRRSELSDVKMKPVIGFHNYLIYFYLDTHELHVIRVLHGARDIASLIDTPDTH
jgi:toxin ParE1/3/4